MNILSWLILAHFLGDWLLQNDWMAIGKRKAFITLAGMIHFSVYTLTVIIIMYMVVGERIALIAFIISTIFIFTTHWFIDATNVVDRWMKFYGQRNQPMMRIMVDQSLHLAILGILDVWLGTIY